MAKQEECSKCKRAKQGGYAGEIKCSFYGRKPLFDDSPCSNFLNVNIKCPECGQEVPPSEKACPNCGCPMKEDVAPSKNNQSEVSSNANNPTPQTSHKKSGAGKVLLFVLVGIALVAGTVFVMKSFSQKEAKAALYDSMLNAEKEREDALEAQQKAEEERRRADPYMEKGWNFLRNGLKSPSTASLVGYVSPNEEPTIDLAKKSGISDVKVATYLVDAQNSYGAMIRTTFYVFFRNGEPRVVFPEEELLEWASNPGSSIRLGLELNGI